MSLLTQTPSWPPLLRLVEEFGFAAIQRLLKQLIPQIYKDLP